MKNVTLAEFIEAVDKREILIRDIRVVKSFIYGQPRYEGEIWRAPV